MSGCGRVKARKGDDSEQEAQRWEPTLAQFCQHQSEMTAATFQVEQTYLDPRKVLQIRWSSLFLCVSLQT